MLHSATPFDSDLSDGDGWCARRRPVEHATPASLHDLLHAMGADNEAMPGSGPTIPVLRIRLGAVLLHEGERSGLVYVVRSGTFKCLKTSEDGYEQVLGFGGRGEVLGFEALYRGQYRAVCLENSTVFELPLPELGTWRQASPALDQALQVALSRQLTHAGEIAEMMAPVAAEVRLARFLAWLSRCMAERGQSPRQLVLRMSRRDIASLLGVAHETVSRSFTALADWGYLRVKNREVEILDPVGLRLCARNTRGLLDEPPRRGAVPIRRLATRLQAAA